MKIRVVCVGRIAEAWLREGVEEYEKRIRRYLPLTTVELKEEKGGRKPDPVFLRQREGERLLDKIPEKGMVAVLDEQGRGVTSEQLADLLGRQMVAGTPELTLVLGGPFGLSEAVKRRGDLLLSLSPLTLTHRMARLLLLEQIYRGLTILRHEPYHNP